MPLIDDRGRLFGKLNLIDAIVGGFVLLLIPLAYGAFLLFRPPPPIIDSVQPVAILDRMPAVVAVTGRNLRPFLRANIGNVPAQFLVASPTAGEIKVPGMPAGTYDVSLWDESTRVVVKSNALTVQATDVSSVIELEAVGTFVGLSRDAAALIGVGARFQPPGAGAGAVSAEVLAARPPGPTMRRVRIGPAMFMVAALPSPSVTAIVRVRCVVGDGACAFGAMAVQRGVTLLLSPSAGRSGPAAPGQVPFMIDQLFPPGTHAAFPSVVTARVRFMGGPELASVIKTGEGDVSPAVAADSDRSAILDGNHAALTAVSPEPQPINGQITIEPQFNANPLRRSIQAQQPVVALSGTVRIPVVFTPLGWTYKDRLVKVGAPFVFESISGTATGWILDVKETPEEPGAAR